MAILSKGNSTIDNSARGEIVMIGQTAIMVKSGKFIYKTVADGCTSGLNYSSSHNRNALTRDNSLSHHYRRVNLSCELETQVLETLEYLTPPGGYRHCYKTVHQKNRPRSKRIHQIFAAKPL